MILDELATFTQHDFNNYLKLSGRKPSKTNELYEMCKTLVSAGIRVFICKRIFKP